MLPAQRHIFIPRTKTVQGESLRSDRKKVIVLGSGPIRIRAGVEFDYATVHCVETLRDRAMKLSLSTITGSHQLNFSISDKLYFDPLTVEDVMHVIDLEQPLGVVVGRADGHQYCSIP